MCPVGSAGENTTRHIVVWYSSTVLLIAPNVGHVDLAHPSWLGGLGGFTLEHKWNQSGSLVKRLTSNFANEKKWPCHFNWWCLITDVWPIWMSLITQWIVDVLEDKTKQHTWSFPCVMVAEAKCPKNRDCGYECAQVIRLMWRLNLFANSGLRSWPQQLWWLMDAVYVLACVSCQPSACKVCMCGNTERYKCTNHRHILFCWQLSHSGIFFQLCGDHLCVTHHTILYIFCWYDNKFQITSFCLSWTVKTDNRKVASWMRESTLLETRQSCWLFFLCWGVCGVLHWNMYDDCLEAASSSLLLVRIACVPSLWCVCLNPTVWGASSV